MMATKQKEGTDSEEAGIEAAEEQREMSLEEIQEDVLNTLHENLEKIAENIYTGQQGWKIWIKGEIGKDEISILGLFSQGTVPNPENYETGEWLIKVKVWTELYDVTYEEEKKIKEEDMMTEVIMDHYLPESLEGWIESKLNIYGYDNMHGKWED